MTRARSTPRAAGAAAAAVLTALALSLIVCALALYAHNQLYSNNLERAQALEETLRRQLDAPPSDHGSEPARGGGDVLELALAKQPAVLSERDRRLLDQQVPLYTDTERRAFVTARVKGDLDDPTETLQPTAPHSVRAEYGDGAVTLAWESGHVNRVLSAALAGREDGLRLAFRIWRRDEWGEMEPLVTVPFGVTLWKDRSLPVARTTLYYEVWTVLLRADPSGSETLVSAERSDLVTLSSPEHFTLELIGGDEVRADFLAVVGNPETPVASVTVSAMVGDPIAIGELSTGLALQSIEMTTVDVLTTREHLSLTSDGAVVIDPATNEPRTTQTQVLIPGRRMKTVLVHQDGETRTLEAELP